MATWNYRVVKTSKGYGIFEVFYDDLGRIEGSTATPTLNFYCETPGALLEELEIIKKAFNMSAIDILETDSGTSG